MKRSIFDLLNSKDVSLPGDVNEKQTLKLEDYLSPKILNVKSYSQDDSFVVDEVDFNNVNLDETIYNNINSDIYLLIN